VQETSNIDGVVGCSATADSKIPDGESRLDRGRKWGKVATKVPPASGGESGGRLILTTSESGCHGHGDVFIAIPNRNRKVNLLKCAEVGASSAIGDVEGSFVHGGNGGDSKSRGNE